MEVDLLLKLANFGLVIVVGLYSWIISRDKATAIEIKELNAEVGRLEARVNTLETDFTHLPDKDSVHRLEIAITKISGDLQTQTEMFRGAVHAVRRVEEYLLAHPVTDPPAVREVTDPIPPKRQRAPRKVKAAA